MLTHFLSCFVLLALGASVPAQDPGRLDRALGVISSEALRADLYFFADPVMRGRPTPSRAQRVAARFLRSRLMRLGLEPAGDALPGGAPRSWFQTLQVYGQALSLRASRLTISGQGQTRKLRLGKDYFLANFDQVQNLELSGEVVYCAAGSPAELRGLELEGRWALCLDGGGRDAKRSAALAERGALGVLLFADPKLPGDSIGRLYPRSQRAKTVGRFALSEPTEAQRAFPELYLKRSTAALLLSLGGGSSDTLPSLGEVLELRLEERRRGSGWQPTENVCALWRGSDPELSQEVIVLSAHYDHLTPQGSRLFPGADDNGSGSMALLALAEALTRYGPTKRSVLLLWTTGEEHRLHGSRAFVASPTLDEGMRILCNVNLDMLGRNAPDSLLVTPSPAHQSFSGLSGLLHELGPLEGFTELGSADEYWKRSDHYSFSTALGIPVAFLFAGVHKDYHKPGDTPDKVNYEKVRRATRLVLRLVDRLQADSLTL